MLDGCRLHASLSVLYRAYFLGVGGDGAESGQIDFKYIILHNYTLDGAYFTSYSCPGTLASSAGLHVPVLWLDGIFSNMFI